MAIWLFATFCMHLRLLFLAFTRAWYGLKQPTHTISATNTGATGSIILWWSCAIAGDSQTDISAANLLEILPKDAPFVAIWETVALEAFGLAWLTKVRPSFPTRWRTLHHGKGLRSVKLMFKMLKANKRCIFWLKTNWISKVKILDWIDVIYSFQPMIYQYWHQADFVIWACETSRITVWCIKPDNLFENELSFIQLSCV